MAVVLTTSVHAFAADNGSTSRSRLRSRLLCRLLTVPPGGYFPQEPGEAEGPGTKPGSQTEARVASVSHDVNGFDRGEHPGVGTADWSAAGAKDPRD